MLPGRPFVIASSFNNRCCAEDSRTLLDKNLAKDI
jgi:hypothetical protein